MEQRSATPINAQSKMFPFVNIFAVLNIWIMSYVVIRIKILRSTKNRKIDRSLYEMIIASILSILVRFSSLQDSNYEPLPHQSLPHQTDQE